LLAKCNGSKLEIQVKVENVAGADRQQAFISAHTDNIIKDHQHPRQMHQSGNVTHLWQLAAWQETQ